ncbi:MAG: Rne/Rng family ribonuclease [Desulfocapsa sp.]|nr:Rne/Rng family ribonuclease [Desulfocapsa sp.]
MVDKKAESKKESVEKKSVKVSTGAWWKSTAKDEPKKKAPDKAESTSESVAKQKKEAPKPRKKAAPKKSSGQARAPRKKPAPRKKSAVEAKPSKPLQEAEALKDVEKTAQEKPSAEGVSPVSDSEERTKTERQQKPSRPRGGKTGTPKSSVAQKQRKKPAPRKKPVDEAKPSKPLQEAEALKDVEQTEQAKPSAEGVSPASDSEERAKTESQQKPSRPRGRKTEAPKGTVRQKQRQKPVDEVEPEEKPQNLRLLVNAEEPEECRLALLADGNLESIHVSTVSSKQTKNNIYKAKIVAIESHLQAAFVDYGTEKNGFLPFDEIHPEYYKQEISEENKKLIQQRQWKKLKIHDVLERGQEILVQVVKEEIGNKGANMTTYLSIPGRCVVLMPGSDSSGISRKISGEERRSQLREIMGSLNIPEGVGWIVRTASVDITKTALTKDVQYLAKLWDEIKKKGQSLEGVGLVYQDHDCVLRFLREHFDPEIKEILVDDLAALEKVKDFLELLPEKQRGAKARLHTGSRPIFNQFNVEDQIESIYQPQVPLPSGGSIVIDPTEALVAIDVNSGSTGKGKNFEESIFKANMEAATELARQLRLRDLGGLIVVDFIDMRVSKNIREVERQVKIAMKRDRAKVDISRISKFGLMQISRQKLGAPIETSNYRVCEHCKGRGVVRSVETLALFYLRRVQTGVSRKNVAQAECHFPLDVAQYLLNNKRQEIIDIESRNKISIVIVADPSLKPADHEIIFHKNEKEQKG